MCVFFVSTAYLMWIFYFFVLSQFLSFDICEFEIPTYSENGRFSDKIPWTSKAPVVIESILVRPDDSNAVTARISFKFDGLDMEYRFTLSLYVCCFKNFLSFEISSHTWTDEKNYVVSPWEMFSLLYFSNGQFEG